MKPIPTLTPDEIQAFFASTARDQATGCLLWQGPITTTGYGHARIQGKQYTAHRVAFSLQNGPISSNVELNHKCSVKHCVEPSHLEYSTRQHNMEHLRDHGVGCGVQKLTPAQVDEIRDQLRQGKKQREIAPAFGVSRATVGRIGSGATWHNGEVLTRRRPRGQGSIAKTRNNTFQTEFLRDGKRIRATHKTREAAERYLQESLSSVCTTVSDNSS